MSNFTCLDKTNGLFYRTSVLKNTCVYAHLMENKHGAYVCTNNYSLAHVRMQINVQNVYVRY